MNVTNSNFKELLPKIKQAINDALFISIDTELTGLHSKFNVNGYDTPKQFYEKVRRSSKDFIIIQFGLCTFGYDDDEETFKNKCYNFYIFRRQATKNIPDRIFLMQSSSIDFLLGHNFDFNKVFQEGIPYLNREDEIKWRDELEKKQSLIANNKSPSQNSVINPLPIPDDDREFIEDAMKKIENFLASDDKEIMLAPCNAFVRRLLYQTVGERYGPQVNLQTRIVENKVRRLFAEKLTPEELVDKQKSKYALELQEIDDAVGFSAVIQHLSESGKLIVGHNMLLDLLHMVDMFLTPLPEEYEDFKECIHCLFPRIIDTKFMASSHLFKDSIPSTVLGHIYQTVQEQPFKVVPLKPDFDDDYQIDTQQEEHEASHDALLTGEVFLALSQYLGIYLKNNPNGIVWPNSSLVKPFINKLFLMRLQDGAYMTLDGPDEIPPRDNVLHVTFPKEWQLQDVKQLFSPFGYVYVAWLDEKSAYVSLNKSDQAAQALNALRLSETCTVISYARHQALTETNLPVKPSPHINRKRPINSDRCSRLTEKKKRQKTSHTTEHFTTKWTCNTIEEEQEVESSPEVNRNKTFFEDTSWN